MTGYIALWMVVIIAAVILEIMTTALLSIWFAAGGLVALVMAIFGVPEYIQFIAFFVVSAAVMALVWPLRKKLQPQKVEKTNADRIIGKEAVVTMDVDNNLGRGQANVNGQIWTARSYNDEKIPSGTHVTIESIEGVKIIVKTVDK